MRLRTAACACGRLTAVCEGEPVRVSVCHCLACQQRTGSAFGAQARFPTERVTISGETRLFERRADSGNLVRHRFCPACGSTVAYQLADQPQVVAIPLGAFADPGFSPPPAFSVYERRRHPWTVVLGDDVEHLP
ncbi:GFA family protein [Phenylobacterium sp.]|uniref:GFA family protein n=1 Tax=Phenylobacterium sp. TaxID=1871053 RepID=UPI0035B19EAD